jgi:4-hydroxybenzoate polyprenyltransferase/phosphoserine phosphatase
MGTIVFDLDGTLVKSDLLHEQLLVFAKQRPTQCLRPLAWLLAGGRARLKEELARSVSLRVDLLPYRTTLVDEARSAASRGERVVLASASAQPVVDAVATHLGCFANAIGTRNGGNLKGASKARQLLDQFPRETLFYVGDSTADLPVWAESGRGGIAVNPSFYLQNRIARLQLPVTPMRDQQSTALALLRSMRVHQWVKNLLLFLPVIAAHTAGQPAVFARAAVAALAFCFASSAVYILNDLFDIESDRLHPTKRTRPLAAGDLPISVAVASVPLLLGTSALLATSLSTGLLAILGSYLVVNLGYTLRLKQMMGVDVVTLALLYSLRVFAGGVATATPISPWLVAFTTFFFFALAVLKRYVEVRHSLMSRSGAAGRDYLASDEPVLLALGVGGHLVSLLVLALYFSNPDVTQLYPRAGALWLLLPLLLYWVMRTWLKAHRGLVDDDPVLYATRDRATYVVLAGGAVIAALAATG